MNKLLDILLVTFLCLTISISSFIAGSYKYGWYYGIGFAGTILPTLYFMYKEGNRK